MADLESQRKDVDIIINYPIKKSLQDMLYEFNGMLWLYAMIVHDKDVHEEDSLETYQNDVCDMNGNIVFHKGDKTGNYLWHKGDPKTKHIHLVISSPKKHRLKVFINFIQKSLDINFNQISILPCDSLAGRIQYLIHKNNPEKYQYSVDDIKTNMSTADLCEYLDEEISPKLTTDQIINICRESKGNRLYIIEKIGIQRYTLYRNTINDIYKAMLYIEDKYCNTI